MQHEPPLLCHDRDSMQRQSAAWHRAGETVAFVPTMGALHEGHLSLVEKARENADRVVVSIFVNPAQFGPNEDYAAYPRNEEADLWQLAKVGCDAVYMPGVAEMYPFGTRTDVRVSGLSDKLEGEYRPHFFYGVTTVVARLFLHVQPDVAVFGEKDFQQLQIIRRMTTDLGFAIRIIGGETQRDADGLAQSSRNQYLSPPERIKAGAIFASLHRARMRLEAGSPARDVLAEAEAAILAAGFSKVDYVRLVDPDALEPLSEGALEIGKPARLLVAAWMGKTRLIDNLSVQR